jgi:hypothetical protein
MSREKFMDDDNFCYFEKQLKMKYTCAYKNDDEEILRQPSTHLTALVLAGLTTTLTDLAKFTKEIMLSHQYKSEKLLSQEMTGNIR